MSEACGSPVSPRAALHAGKSWWRRRESNPHHRTAKAASCLWTTSPKLSSPAVPTGIEPVSTLLDRQAASPDAFGTSAQLARVWVAGIEPAAASFQARTSTNDLHPGASRAAPAAGFEPAILRLTAGCLSAWPRWNGRSGRRESNPRSRSGTPMCGHQHLVRDVSAVPPLGVEPRPSALQTDAQTCYARVGRCASVVTEHGRACACAQSMDTPIPFAHCSCALRSPKRKKPPRSPWVAPSPV